MITFGPIPSRRLGQSLGINHIPPKVCSYNCVYCQVGATTLCTLDRRPFYTVDEIVQAVEQKVAALRADNMPVDYLSFVPDGEPTLDINLGEAIKALKPLGIKIAVFSNSSLLWMPDVREELALADLVSLKFDAVEEYPWHKINRCHGRLSREGVLKGGLLFAQRFEGVLITETMLVEGINDSVGQLTATAEYLQQLHPDTAYIAIPTRPPVETWAQAPGEQSINRAYQIFSDHLDSVECLLGFPDDSYSVSEDVVQNILDITCVHPMRESEVYALLKKAGKDQSVLIDLVDAGKLAYVNHNGQQFFIRKLEEVSSEF